MSDIKRKLASLIALLEAPTSYTNENKIFAPEPSDPNIEFKHQLLDRAHTAIQLGQAGLNAPVPLLENEFFSGVDKLPDADSDKTAYYTLVNATQALLRAINESAT